MRKLSYANAINEAMFVAMQKSKNVITRQVSQIPRVFLAQRLAGKIWARSLWICQLRAGMTGVGIGLVKWP